MRLAGYGFVVAAPGDLPPHRARRHRARVRRRGQARADRRTRTRRPSPTSTTTSAPRSTGWRPTTAWRRRPLRDRALHGRPPGVPRRVRPARARDGAVVSDRPARRQARQGRRRGLARARVGDPRRDAADLRHQRSAHARGRAVRSSSEGWRRPASASAGACTKPSTPSGATSARATTRRRPTRRSPRPSRCSGPRR